MMSRRRRSREETHTRRASHDEEEYKRTETKSKRQTWKMWSHRKASQDTVKNMTGEFGHPMRNCSFRTTRDVHGTEEPCTPQCGTWRRGRSRNEFKTYLGHLLSVRRENHSVHDEIFEGWAVKQSRAENHERVEPSTRLIDPLSNEICGKPFLPLLLVFERIVTLSVRHTSGLEPTIKHLISCVKQMRWFFDTTEEDTPRREWYVVCVCERERERERERACVPSADDVSCPQ